jgi:hypothetical protein
MKPRAAIRFANPKDAKRKRHLAWDPNPLGGQQSMYLPSLIAERHHVFPGTSWMADAHLFGEAPMSSEGIRQHIANPKPLRVHANFVGPTHKDLTLHNITLSLPGAEGATPGAQYVLGKQIKRWGTKCVQAYPLVKRQGDHVVDFSRHVLLEGSKSEWANMIDKSAEWLTNNTKPKPSRLRGFF